MDSENANGCPQNAENGFGFVFLERYQKEDTTIIQMLACTMLNENVIYKLRENEKFG
jgi:tRNA(Ile2) C34 agmatinyltransferase TiaS